MFDLDANPELRRLFRIARLRVSLGFAVAAVAFYLARPTWTSVGVGTLVAALGEGLRVWAAGHLEKGREVTCSGPYRLTRHPLYVGSAVIGVGFVMVSASVPVAVIVLGYLLVMLFAAVRLEEATLRDGFGEQYDRYAAGVLPAPQRWFSVRRAIANGEHRALLGFMAAVAILGLKAWYAP